MAEGLKKRASLLCRARHKPFESSRLEQFCFNKVSDPLNFLDGENLYSFPVFFTKDDDGNWKIFRF
jgi:hypothetical protein